MINKVEVGKTYKLVDITKGDIRLQNLFSNGVTLPEDKTFTCSELFSYGEHEMVITKTKGVKFRGKEASTIQGSMANGVAVGAVLDFKAGAFEEVLANTEEE